MWETKMQIFYDAIQDDSGLSLETSFTFRDAEESYNIKSFQGNVDKAGDAYFLHGEMVFETACVCDRCLKEMNIEIKQDIAVTLSPLGEYPAMKGEDEDGLSDEEAGMYVTETLSFDLDEILREEALLATPIKRLCSENCKGLCLGCGADLNNEPCRCVQKGDERFNVLSKLKTK